VWQTHTHTHTDIQTHDNSIYCTRIASCGKNYMVSTSAFMISTSFSFVTQCIHSFSADTNTLDLCSIPSLHCTFATSVLSCNLCSALQLAFGKLVPWWTCQNWFQSQWNRFWFCCTIKSAKDCFSAVTYQRWTTCMNDRWIALRMFRHITQYAHSKYCATASFIYTASIHCQC